MLDLEQVLREWVLTNFPSFRDLKKLNSHVINNFCEENYYLTRLTIILSLAGGFFKLARLFSLLESMLKMTPLYGKSLPDTLIIPTKINTGQENYRETSETLSGVCAAATVAWLKHKPNSIELEKLNNWIYESLPNEIKP